MQERGIDVGDDALMTGRSWRWLRTRILGLLTGPHYYDTAGNPRYSSRLQMLFPPPAPNFESEGR